MAKIVVDIDKCNKCPHFKETRYWTEDSWEHANDWWCTKKVDTNEKGGFKKIAGYVEWMDVKGIEIPKWCPAKV